MKENNKQLGEWTPEEIKKYRSAIIQQRDCFDKYFHNQDEPYNLSFVYHYTTLDAFEKHIFPTDTLRFSNIAKFQEKGDSKEFILGFDLYKKKLNEIITNEKAKLFFNELLPSVDTISKTLFVLCLSTLQNNNEMYKNFSNTKSDKENERQEGYSLEFDQSYFNYNFTDNLKSESSNRYLANNHGLVIYSKHKQEEVIELSIRSLESMYNDYYNKNIGEEELKWFKSLFIHNLASILSFFKHEDFMEEQEYRYIVVGEGKDGFEHASFRKIDDTTVVLPIEELWIDNENVTFCNIEKEFIKKHPRAIIQYNKNINLKKT